MFSSIWKSKAKSITDTHYFIYLLSPNDLLQAWNLFQFGKGGEIAIKFLLLLQLQEFHFYYWRNLFTISNNYKSITIEGYQFIFFDTSIWFMRPLDFKPLWLVTFSKMVSSSLLAPNNLFFFGWTFRNQRPK